MDSLRPTVYDFRKHRPAAHNRFAASGMWQHLPAPTGLFLALALVFSLSLAVLIPPLQAADEHAHFLRAYALSEGVIVPTVFDQRVGAFVPAALSGEPWMPFFDMIFHPDRKIGIEEYRHLWSLQSDESRQFMDFPNMAYHAPITYIPQAFGIMVARQLTDRPLVWLYAGRWANAMVWLLLITGAIAIVPTGRWLLAALALIPTAIFQAASLSQDACVTGLAYLLFAYLVRMACEPSCEWSRTRVAAMACLGALVALSKFVYAPLLLLAVPSLLRSSVSARRKILHAGIIFGVPILALVGWFLAIRHAFVPYENYHPAYRDWVGGIYPGTDTASQVRMVIMHPLRVIVEFVRNAVVHRIPYRYAGWLGWDIILPRWLNRILLSGLAVMAVVDARSDAWPRGFRWVMVLSAFLLPSAAIYLVAFIWWSPVGVPMPDLIHGRYWMPLAPGLFFLLASGYARVNTRLKSAWFIGMTMCSLSTTIIVILRRFYLVLE